MATYTAKGNATELSDLELHLSERHLYGSSRLGILTETVDVDNNNTGPEEVEEIKLISYYRGYRLYELSNHLGNVLATVSDKKSGIDHNSDEEIDYFEPEIITASDYYPFGMLMPGRGGSLINGQWQNSWPTILANLSVDDRTGNQPSEYIALESIEFLDGFESGLNDEFVAYITTLGNGEGYEGEDGLYRYGFNGKEMDKETSSTITYDYGFRIYSPVLGRFLSVDPLTKNYPWYTPYQFAGNTPLQAIDVEGAEPLYVNYVNGFKVGNPKITKSSQWYVYSYTISSMHGSHTSYVTDSKTYNSAAQFNSINLNSQFYSSFGQKEEYYKWAQIQMIGKKINTQWFAMDAKIVGPYEVGLTELDPGVMLSKDTKGFLNHIGSLVLQENMEVYNQLNSNGSFNGKTGGMALDRELLYNEQSKIQDFMSSLEIKDLDKYLSEYNSGFKVFQAIKGKDHYLNVASSVIGGDIDFGSIKHRMVIGQVLMYQMHGQKIDDKARQTIMNNSTEDTGRYYKERYGYDD